MDTWFPTFRRLSGIHVRVPSFWPWRASRGQRRALLRLILVAAEQNLPLAPLLEAWAADEFGMQKRRLRRLASLLHDGRSLPDALEEVRDALADDEVLAVRFGSQSGTLIASLRALLGDGDSAAASLIPRWHKTLFYYGVILLVALLIVSFLQIKIVPEFKKIMQEFNIESPPSLQWTVGFANFTVNYWFLFALAIVAGCWLVFTSWPGRRLRQAILVRLLPSLRDYRIADILQQLSIAAQAGRPAAGAISTLARYHFDPVIRNRLLFIRNEMEQGADIWQSMGEVGLLDPREVRVLESAERVGNRPWALQQLALHKRRQTTRRLAHRTELAFPVVILLLGGFVLFQALGVFGPLVTILQSLL